MAAIALRAVLTQMPIVLLMTDTALLRHFHGAWRLSMAGGALQFAVGTQEWEMGILGVIKRPQRPAVG
jgi:hypothetical protein